MKDLARSLGHDHAPMPSTHEAVPAPLLHHPSRAHSAASASADSAKILSFRWFMGLLLSRECEALGPSVKRQVQRGKARRAKRPRTRGA